MDNYCRTKSTFRSGCCETPCTFVTTEVGGVDDRKQPPANGAAFNTIVKYLVTGNVYMYDSYGIPTKIGGDVPLDDYLSLDSTNGVQNNVITGAINELRDSDDSLRNSMASLDKLMNSQYTELKEQIKKTDVVVHARAFDPTTGLDSPLQQVVDNLYGWAQENAITAGEFDAINPTCETFNEYDMNATQFDTESKVIMGAEDTTDIAFPEDTIELERGATTTVELTVTPDAGSTPITVESADTTKLVATIEGRTITLHAIAKGEVEVTATAGELTATATVNVVAPAIASMTFDSETATVETGQTLELPLSVLPVGAEGEVEFTSSTESVATVTGEGFVATVEGVSAGETVITATSGEVTANITVTVTDPEG